MSDITPAMIGAGIDAIDGEIRYEDDRADAVTRIYRAMRAVELRERDIRRPLSLGPADADTLPEIEFPHR